MEGIIAEANEKGIADITRVWRDFQSCINAMEEVCLEAIRAGATMKSVCSRHTQTDVPAPCSRFHESVGYTHILTYFRGQHGGR